MYAPSTGSGCPVVVYFHGGQPDPVIRKTVVEASALAEQGLVVFVPSWQSVGPVGGSEDTVRAVAFAQARADKNGRDTRRTTLSGYSTGGFTAAIHGLIGDEPPLPSGDCLVGATMELPGAVVPLGTPFFAVAAARAGAFANNPQWSLLTSEPPDAFDPHLALGKNPDVRFVQVVGRTIEEAVRSGTFRSTSRTSNITTHWSPPATTPNWFCSTAIAEAAHGVAGT